MKEPEPGRNETVNVVGARSGVELFFNRAFGRKPLRHKELQNKGWIAPGIHGFRHLKVAAEARVVGWIAPGIHGFRHQSKLSFASLASWIAPGIHGFRHRAAVQHLQHAGWIAPGIHGFRHQFISHLFPI